MNSSGFESSVSWWSNFFHIYYAEEVSRLSVDYPSETVLVVDYNDITLNEIDVAKDLLSHPDKVLNHARKAIEEQNPFSGIEVDPSIPIVIEIENLPEDIQIRDLRSKHINSLISISATVTRVSEIRPLLTMAAFRCLHCTHVSFMAQNQAGVHQLPVECENDSCGRKNQFTLDMGLSTFDDAQKIIIQEDTESLKGTEQPQTLIVSLINTQVSKVPSGSRVKVVGIYRSYQRSNKNSKSNLFDVELDAVHIDAGHSDYDDIEISPEDVEIIKELAASSDIFEKITQSIAPSIYGYDVIKQALAFQLFGGVAKNLPDGSRIRSDSHILLIGDPGVAKSQLIRRVVKLTPRGIFTSAKSSSAAGLTSTAVKMDFGDGDSRWVIEAGALPRAHKGMVAVDELDKMNSNDRGALHEAMEQQVISYAKAGLVGSLQCQCSLLAAANPVDGRFDNDIPHVKQINLGAALLSRFDLIFFLTDVPNKQVDYKISSHILNVHKVGQLLDSKDSTESMPENFTIEPPISFELFRKYIAYARLNVHPVLTEAATELINEFYLKIRSQGYGECSPVPATARQLEALVRLAESSARVRLSDTISVEDVNRVIHVTTTSIEQTLTDPLTGKIDADLVEGTKTHSQRDFVKTLFNTIKELQRADTSTPQKVHVDKIVSAMFDKGLGEPQTKEYLRQMKIDGRIHEVTDGFYGVV